MMFTNDSDQECNENEFYHRKYRLLVEKCESLQQSNEMIVHRIQHMKKYVRRIRKQRLMLMRWLDKYNDDWRNSDYPVDIAVTEDGTYVDLLENSFVESSPLYFNKRLGRKSKSSKDRGKACKRRKEGRGEKDPNAPKRPANPFFQFCQEQRPLVLDSMTTAAAGTEPSKQDLTKQLAANWNILSRKDKKVYYDKYMKSKEEYLVNMEQYTKAKQEQEGGPYEVIPATSLNAVT